MKSKHIAFWILMPLAAVFFLLLTLFLFDLLNGPMVLFIFALILVPCFVVASILFINHKKRFRVIPWGAYITMFALLAGLSFPVTKAVPASLSNKQEKTSVLHMASGPVQGVYSKDKEVEIYAGIPYAEAPIGDLRWKEPVPIADWSMTKDCTYFAPKSMQNQSNPMMDTLIEMYAEKGWHPDYRMHAREPISEDSLYLNIWRPAKIEGPLPILFYIHGGSLNSGSASFLDYNGETMAKHGVIMVTIAYRLGVFGYFAHPDLIEESPNNTTGNYGLLDQIEALRFIKKNAASFGGDPERITIAGESAGSSAVSAICASPLASGLFSQAIGESSSVVGYKAPHTFRKMEQALERGQNIMKEMKCSSIEELRKLPAKKLQKTAYSNSAMTVDGYALPKTPHEIYRDGGNNEKALLNGYNVKEADAFVVPNFLFSPTNESNIRQRLIGYFDEEAADAFLEAYASEIKKDAFGAFNDIISAYWFMQPHMDWSKAAIDNGETVYRYQFTKENGYYGTFHSGEMIYCYGNLDKSTHQFAYDESDRALSETMVSYWSNFVKNGDPNGEGLPQWNAWTGEEDPLQELGAHVGPIAESAKKAYPILNAFKERSKD